MTKIVKIGFATEFDIDVAQGYTNFLKPLSITITHLHRFRIRVSLCVLETPDVRPRPVIFIHTVLQKFACPFATRYADFIGFYGTPPLKYVLA